MIEFDILDVLETPTQQRSENTPELDPFENDDFLNGLEFDTPEENIEAVEQEEEPTPTIEEIYTDEDAQINAEILVDLLDTVNTATLTPLARWKLRKKRGGKDVVSKMSVVYEKSLKDEKLTDKEKELAWKYEAYLKDKEQLENAIPYTDDEKRKLVASAKNYVKGKKIKINADLSFWGELAMIQGSRIMQILTA